LVLVSSVMFWVRLKLNFISCSLRWWKAVEGEVKLMVFCRQFYGYFSVLPLVCVSALMFMYLRGFFL
jgi:hypothetical protein